MRPPFRTLFLVFGLLAALIAHATAGIPLPEHPRPDFERSQWQNLNGEWSFEFERDAAQARTWGSDASAFTHKITVPFSWAAPLSGVENKGDIAWYSRQVKIPESWKGKRIYVVVGASDWITQGWFAGQTLGEHRGGYTPFEFELTSHVRWGQDQTLAFRVDDTTHPFKLEGKQGYGAAKGIWQTVYLEARSETFLKSVHFTPDIDRGVVVAHAELSQPAAIDAQVALEFRTGGIAPKAVAVKQGAREVTFEVAIPQAHLWSLEDPFLYEVDAVASDPRGEDRVKTYFGMRKVSVVDLPGQGHPYVALNGKPIYLQLTLDQSYHETGYYTFPTDEFMRDEILRSKRLGLNGNRVHIKVEVPRKLYWADKLGLLIMADVPNSWGEPTPEARAESEFAMRGMIARDFNHPAIFSWVVFNETWGLFTNPGTQSKTYLPETQDWVISMYKLAKQLDPTRLVEDNSACNGDHTETDLNSWHDYLPGYLWGEHLKGISEKTFPGSPWNFIGGRKQGRQPMFNSECGNVWGYEGSTGDVDFTWDYHILMNEFRRNPKVAGWLYTEHHDVINEWNGYYRFDRSEKITGLEDFVPGMTLADLHAPLYLSTGSDLCRDVAPGEKVEVPLFASFMTDRAPAKTLVIRGEVHALNSLGQREPLPAVSRPLDFRPWLNEALPPLTIEMPKKPSLVVLALTLETPAGVVLQRNFTTFRVKAGPAAREETLEQNGQKLHLVRFTPATFSSAQWSAKQWNVLDGLKVNGAGYGYFEYKLRWPKGVDAARVTGATLVFEASAKQLFGKDREGAKAVDGDFMRGLGDHDPSANPNAYPMTDQTRHPSEVWVRVNGASQGSFELPNDPADHRGVLSWHAQLRDKKLREAGSYGYLTQVVISPEALRQAAGTGEIVIRFEVTSALPGGLALYGEDFGRYPTDPTLVIETR